MTARATEPGWRVACAAAGLLLLVCSVAALLFALEDPLAARGLRQVVGGEARKLLRRLQPQQQGAHRVYCTADFGGYVDASEPGRPVHRCPTSTACACSAVEENEDLFHCGVEAAASPCAWARAPPSSYPKPVFFASFRADMTSRYSGSSAIWNSTGWWVYDSEGKRQRMDITTHVRSLSSGSHLNTFRHSARTLAADDGGHLQTVVYDASAQDLFIGGKAPTCQRTTVDRFPDRPLTGNARHYLPSEFNAMGWSTHEDRPLGTDYVNGRATTLWGWTLTRGGMEVGGHRVWLDAEGTPVREEQWNSLGGQGTRATVHFSQPEDAFGSFAALMANTDELFRLPHSCH